jgi:hypothetical protein
LFCGGFQVVPVPTTKNLILAGGVTMNTVIMPTPEALASCDSKTIQAEIEIWTNHIMQEMSKIQLLNIYKKIFPVVSAHLEREGKNVIYDTEGEDL